MFGLRAQQLQRQLFQLIENSPDPQFKQFAESLMAYIFGNVIEHTALGKSSLLQSLFAAFHQLSPLEQIFLRALSQLSTDQVSEATLYRLFAIVIFGNALIEYLAEPTEPIQNSAEPLVFCPNLKLNQAKYNNLKEMLSKAEKKQNAKIDSISDMLQYVLERAPSAFDALREIATWGQILEYVYGVNLLEQSNGIKKLDKGNLKEMILNLNYEGPLVQDLFKRYDGLLAFTMGIFTMISGTEFDTPDVQQNVNSILTTIGTSSRVMLNLQRLRKNAQQRNEIFDEMQMIATDVLTKIQNHSLSSIQPLFLKFLEIITSPPLFNFEMTTMSDLGDLPGFNDIFKSAVLANPKTDLERVWISYRINIFEVQEALKEVFEFLGTVVKKANDTVLILKAKKLQKALPRHDIEAIEAAGIQIQPIISGSASVEGTSSIEIPQVYIDQKTKLVREFQSNWQQLSRLFQVWAKEEQNISALGADLRPFGEINRISSQAIESISNRKAFVGQKEETILILRGAGSANMILDGMLLVLEPVKTLRFNKANLEKFVPLFQRLLQSANALKDLADVIGHLNDISKNLLNFTRDPVVSLGLNTEYVDNPTTFESMLNDIPNQIQREMAQKYISKEGKDTKMKVYESIVNNVRALAKMRSSQRKLLWPLEDFVSC